MNQTFFSVMELHSFRYSELETTFASVLRSVHPVKTAAPGRGSPRR
jgi:hypothetical protein